jgi:hypothetical protein
LLVEYVSTVDLSRSLERSSAAVEALIDADIRDLRELRLLPGSLE